MALSNSVDSVEAVFKTAESRTPEVLASVLETLKELREGGAEGSLVKAAKICADASREGMHSFCGFFNWWLWGVQAVYSW